jgi:hypothetical protein
MNETNYRNKLQVELSTAGLRAFRNNVGIFFTHDGTPTRCGLCTGSGDLIGLMPVTITPDMVGKKISIFISIETKSKKGIIRDAQQKWADMVKCLGGIAIFARPGDDVVGVLTERLKNI